MPFVSRRQERWAFATGQPFARRWAGMTDQASLPVSKGHRMAARKKKSKFDQLAGKLAAEPGVTDPKGLAASIGRKKYGAGTMGRAAAQGRPAASVKRGGY